VNISVIGAGYVGLVTAACLSKLGHTVRCIDSNEERVEQLGRGAMPIAEPGLRELVSAGQTAGTLTFHSSPEASRGTDLTIVAVGTLDEAGHWTADQVRRTVLDIAGADLSRSIVIRSTLMPGTARDILAEARTLDPRIEIAHNPEFTREGSAVSDFLAPDRIVIGVEVRDGDSELQQMLVAMYEPIDAPKVVTDLTSAEVIKVGSNVFLATKIAFANELARLCAAVGADVHTVVDAIARDPRIGRAFMSPGPGFGGACLPSQSGELPVLAERLGVRTPLIDAIVESNAEAMRWIVEQTKVHLGGTFRGKIVALFGVTFKAGTDDTRESPALVIARQLASEGAHLQLYDPTDAARALPLLTQVEVAVACSDPEEAAAGAAAVIVLTEWPEFLALDWRRIADRMSGRLIVDGRGVVDPVAAASAGLELVGFGRPAASS